MSEKFYEKFLSFIFGLALIFVLVSVTIQLLIIHLQSQNIIFYYAYVGMMLFSAFYGTKYYREFRDFKGNLNLFIPCQNTQNGNCVEPLNIDVEDLPLKVCLWYQQGAGYSKIQKDLGFSYIEQVRRELRKGLSFLLRYYNEHEKVKDVGLIKNA